MTYTTPDESLSEEDRERMVDNRGYHWGGDAWRLATWRKVAAAEEVMRRWGVEVRAAAVVVEGGAYNHTRSTQPHSTANRHRQPPAPF
jgi:hypothetical protein